MSSDADTISVSALLSRFSPSSEAPALRAILLAVLSSCAGISQLLRCGGPTLSTATAGGSHNAFGDVQLKVDVAADALIRARLARTGYVHVTSSEEEPTEDVVCTGDSATYSVGYDPLDGSSVVRTNFSVGSIFGVWRTPHIVGAQGSDLVLAVAAVYGPRTAVYVGGSSLPSCTGGVYEIDIGVGCCQNPDDEGLLLSSAALCLQRMHRGEGESEKKVKLFAPANLRAANELEWYQRLVAEYMQQRYTLRYTGAMVPDVTQLLVKRGGVFASPVSDRAKAKLRLVYEAMPMAALVEAAGGRATDGTAAIMARTVQGCDERTGICVGSAEEVGRFERMCGGGAE